ncbi:hypothetical protein FQN54_007636 [Arachnomyces sp. PD_36]|nr:hypothetical protein FQN54_007636 [Arachnomyces sp. PD_36]
MSGNTNTNMTAAMATNDVQDPKADANQQEKTIYTKEETSANSGWYDKIKDFMPGNQEKRVETIREIEAENVSAGAKIEALVNIIGMNNRDRFEGKDELAKMTDRYESVTLEVEAQSMHIGIMEEERAEEKRTFDELMKSNEELKRQLAASKNFLQSAENGNRQLNEDLAEKANALGAAGKCKKNLTKLFNGQRKEIEKLVEEREYLMKEVMTNKGLVEKYEAERGQWAREIMERRGPLWRENGELRAQVQYLQRELEKERAAAHSGTEGSSPRKALPWKALPWKTLPSSRATTPVGESLSEELKGEELGEEKNIDFQPPEVDRLSAVAAVRSTATGKPNPDVSAFLCQLSCPSQSTFWLDGVKTETGFKIPRALAPVSTDAGTDVCTGSLDAGVQTDAAGSTVSSCAQTVDLEVHEASVQTEDRTSGSSKDGEKAPVQTGESVAPPRAEWKGWSLIIMMLLGAMYFFWGHKDDRQLWIEANGVSRDALVELRDSTVGAIPWLQVVSYNLITWLQVDRVDLG